MFAYYLAGLLHPLKADCKGVTALEYAVIAGVIVVTVSLAVPGLAATLPGIFGPIAAAL